MSQVEVSIIIPLYNAERYLEETMTCIDNQAFERMEVIVINDGSTDYTEDIVKRHITRNERIRYFKNDVRMGAAYSRNKGLQHSVGKYCVFWDGDDIYDENLVSRLYSKAKEFDADVVLCEYSQCDSNDILKDIQSKGNFLSKKSSFPYFCIKEVKMNEVVHLPSSLGGLFFKRDFVSRENIHFQNLESSNDVYFSLYSLFVANRIVFMESEKVLWKQRIHNTYSRISNNRKPINEYLALKKLGEELIASNKMEELVNQYLYRTFSYFVTTVQNEKNIAQKKKYYEFLKSTGIDEVLLMMEGYKNIIDDSIFRIVDLYKNCTMDFEWYDRMFGFESYLQANKEDLLRKVNNRRIAVWGAGKHGKVFERFCVENDIIICKYIDTMESRNGEIGVVYTITNDTSLEGIDLVVVTPFESEKIIEMCMNKKVEVVELCKFIGWK